MNMLTALLLASMLAATSTPVPVYVTSIGAQHGLTDPSKANRDTVADLSKALAEYKSEVRLVTTPDEALIILTVLNREVGNQSTGVFGGQSRDLHLTVKFQAGTVETELATMVSTEAFNTGPWRKAAGKIAKQVREWIAANREKI